MGKKRSVKPKNSKLEAIQQLFEDTSHVPGQRTLKPAVTAPSMIWFRNIWHAAGGWKHAKPILEVHFVDSQQFAPGAEQVNGLKSALNEAAGKRQQARRERTRSFVPEKQLISSSLAALSLASCSATGRLTMEPMRMLSGTARSKNLKRL